MGDVVDGSFVVDECDDVDTEWKVERGKDGVDDRFSRGGGRSLV